MIHHVEVEGGDQVYIDLGGWGLVMILDEQKRFYDVYYVQFRHQSGQLVPYLVPAEMKIQRGRATKQLKNADKVRIMRH